MALDGVKLRSSELSEADMLVFIVWRHLVVVRNLEWQWPSIFVYTKTMNLKVGKFSHSTEEDERAGSF